MGEKDQRSLVDRIKSNCAENRNSFQASRYSDTGLTDRTTKISSRNFTKMMKQRNLGEKAAKDLKDSFQPGTMEARHGKKGEAFVITHGTDSASGVFVSSQSLGKTPAERINTGALPLSNSAEYETRVVLDRDQTVLTGKIAAQPDFAKQDPARRARAGGGVQTVTDDGFKSGAVRQNDPKYPVPVQSDAHHPVAPASIQTPSHTKGQKR